MKPEEHQEMVSNCEKSYICQRNTDDKVFATYGHSIRSKLIDQNNFSASCSLAENIQLLVPSTKYVVRVKEEPKELMEDNAQDSFDSVQNNDDDMHVRCGFSDDQNPDTSSHLRTEETKMSLAQAKCKRRIKVEPEDDNEHVKSENVHDLHGTIKNCEDDSATGSPCNKIQSVNQQEEFMTHVKMEVEVDGKMMCNSIDDLNTANYSMSEKLAPGVLSKSDDFKTEMEDDGEILYNNVQQFGDFEIFNDESSSSDQSAFDLPQQPLLQQLSQKQSHSCHQCGKLCSTKQKLKIHLISHSEERPFSCDLCGKSFKSKDILRAHFNCHSEERPFACEHCGKTFKSKDILRAHLPRHSDERPYPCHHCGKAFKTRIVLRSHLVIHSNERPYVCSQCGKAFKTQGSLKSHLVSHSEERPFSCKQCGKAFKKKYVLSKHIRYHSKSRSVNCHDCGKVFPGYPSFARHRVVHLEEKLCAFSCCGNLFKTRSELVEHLVRHSADDPSKTTRFKMRLVLKNDPSVETFVK